MSNKDYYAILGVDKKASKDDIKKAFYKLAHKYHPDKKEGDEAKFKEVNEAYTVLSDEQKRAQYDMYGSNFANMGGAGNAGQGFGGFDFSGFTQGGQGVEFDLGDIFGEMFGGGGRRQRERKGRDISVDLEIDFKDAVFGTEETISLNKTSACDRCHGNGGEPGSGTEKCTTCDGKGKVQQTQTSFFGTFSTVATCPTCHGKGESPKEKCTKCKGAGITKGQEDITIRIPAGIETGETIRMSGAGEATQHGQSGDLYIRVHVKKHKLFTKQGSDLLMNLDVKLTDALLGATQTLETLDGKIDLKIPAGVSSNEVLRVKGKGVPTRGGRGNLLVTIQVKIPNKLSRKEKELIEELKKEGL